MRLAVYPPVNIPKADEDEGTYISDNKIWEFSKIYDMTASVLYRNRAMQPRKLFTASVEAGKTRVEFADAINSTDEIIIISNK